MNTVGFVKHASAFLRFITVCSKRSGEANLLGTHAGFSLAFATDGSPIAFSLFAFARAVFHGGDAQIRTCLLQQINLHGAPWKIYEQISEPLAYADTRQTYHGMVTFTITNEGKTGLQVGLRPPTVKDNHQFKKSEIFVAPK